MKPLRDKLQMKCLVVSGIIIYPAALFRRPGFSDYTYRWQNLLSGESDMSAIIEQALHHETAKR